VRLGERVALGGGVDLQRPEATLANMIDFGSVGAAFGLPLAPQQHDGKVEFTGSDWAAGFDIGMMIDASPRTRFGVTYRSEVEHQLDGEADFTLPAAAGALTAGGRLFADTGARVTLPMPHEISTSASHRVGNQWTLLTDVTWTRWSAFRELAVTFDNPLQPPVRQDARWDNSLRVAGGALARVGERWSLRGGAAYETTPVPDATRTPRLPERNHTWLATSATYGGDRWHWDVHFTHLITPDAPIAIDDAAAGALRGTVHWRLNIAGVSATIRF
jgi:long-chain fatty acid transport protein